MTRARWTMKESVKILVEMPLDDYDVLLAKCPPTNVMYEILKNGLVTPYPDGNDSTRTVVVLCTEADAAKIVDLARQLYPSAAPNIRQYPAGD